MPGLIGAYSGLPSLSASACTEKMSLPMLYEPQLRAEWRGGEVCAIGCVANDVAVRVVKSPGATLAWDGVIVDLQPLRDRLRAAEEPLPPNAITGDVLLAAWRTFGAKALCGLNGLYVIAVWEPADKRLTIVNDRYGFRKLYYTQLREGLFFAGELKGLLALDHVPRSPDPVAVAQFLRTSYFVEERTPFERIKRLPPGTVATFHQNRLVLTPYGGLQFGDPGEKHTRADVIAETAHQLKVAVKRRLMPGTALLLTGGLDSRSIAGAAHQEGLPAEFFAATIGHEPCHDITYGRRIAASVGMNHRTLEIGPDYLQRFGPAAARRMEGMVSLHGCWHVAPDVLFHGGDARNVMTGSITTGVRSAEARLGQLPRRYQWWHRHEGVIRYEFEHHMAGGFSEEDMPHILPSNSSPELVHAAYEAFRRRFHQAPTDWVPSKVDYATMMEYERRYIAVNFDMLGALFGVQTPFLDNDLVDYTWATKPAVPLGGAEYKEMIVRHFPEVAGVPQTHAWVPLNASWLRTKATRAMARLYYRGLPAISGGRFAPHDYGAYAHHNDWTRTGSRAFVEQVLSKAELLEDLVNMDTVRTIVADHMSGRANTYNKICLLTSLALFRAELSGQSIES